MYKLLINDRKFEFFRSYNINMKFDSIADTFNFEGQKDFLPAILTYPECKILDENDNVIITGTIVNQPFELDSNPTLINVSGYSKPGILEDCTIPITLYPLQSDNLSLKQILDKILKPYGINYKYTSNITAEINKKFKKTNANPDQRIKDYINQLASQRGIILSHNAAGELVLTKLELTNILSNATFEEGDIGILSMVLEIPGQTMHNEISVVKQASIDNPDAGQSTIYNPYCKDSSRSIVKVMSSGDIFDVENAAKIELAKEIGMIKLIITSTKLVYPGNIISVKAPSLKIFNYYDFFVETLEIRGQTNQELYTITAVLKDVYTLDYPPQYIFEEEIDYGESLPRF